MHRLIHVAGVMEHDLAPAVIGLGTGVAAARAFNPAIASRLLNVASGRRGHVHDRHRDDRHGGHHRVGVPAWRASPPDPNIILRDEEGRTTRRRSS